MQLQHPGATLQQYRLMLDRLRTNLQQHVTTGKQRRRAQWFALTQSLEQLSPLNTLQRGYALVHKVKHPTTRTHITSISALAKQDLLEIQLQDGKCQAKVQEIMP